MFWRMRSRDNLGGVNASSARVSASFVGTWYVRGGVEEREKMNFLWSILWIILLLFFIW